MSEQTAEGQGAPCQQMATLKTKALLENLPPILECVTRWAETVGFDARAIYQIQLAVDEACANVIHHAYENMEPGDMEVTCCVEDQLLTIQVRDWGQAFDPDSVPDPDLEAPLEERSLGGLGLFLMRQVMDCVQFTFDPEQGNELVMTKRLAGAG
jgi:serine/threonine-protein kinase RsbW